MLKHLLFILSLLVGLAACEPSPLSPPATSALESPSTAQGAITVPLLEVIVDFNPCTSEPITLTFTGMARIREFDDHFLLVARGSVVTSDGYSGTFNRQLVFHGDRVVHLRFHDMEVNNETGQRIVFAVGFFHQTSVSGEPVVTFEHFTGARCVGPGSA